MTVIIRMLLRSAAVVFFLSSYCVPSLGHTPAGFEAGVSLLLHASDYSDPADLSSKMEALLLRLASLNVNAISLVWPIYTDGVASNDLHSGAETPKDSAIAAAVALLHAHGFSVMLRPIIDEHVFKDEGAGDWRGTIRPADPAVWFKNYGTLILHYASLAQSSGADTFIIGVELNSMEKYTTSWKKLIGEVRKLFAGRLSYSSNQGINGNMPWKLLDFIGIDAFFALQTEATEATAADMQAATAVWVAWMRRKIAAYRLPLVLTEVGSESQTNAHKRPWLWDHGSAVDLEDQRRYYEATCAAWKPAISGMYWWDVTLNQPADPTNDGDFTPLGKPAEAEMASCFVR